MRKTLVLLTILLSPSWLWAQKIPKLPTPPNCVWVEEGAFFIDQTEISNLQWQEYEFWMKKNAPNLKVKLVPDSTVWAALGTGDAYIQHYYQYPGFNHFPVVGISYEQAQEYCRWRSRIVTQQFNENKKRKYQGYQVRFTFRLPKASEWERVAEKGYDPRRLKKWGDKNLGNFRKGKSTPNPLISEYVFAYLPNAYGVYNIFGNVAELCQEKGMAKGGSWRHSQEESSPENSQRYEEPSMWLGFRALCEVELIPQ